MTAILPFWQRLRAISLYPFQSAALYTVIVLTVLIAVGGLLPGSAGCCRSWASC